MQVTLKPHSGQALAEGPSVRKSQKRTDHQASAFLGDDLHAQGMGRVSPVGTRGLQCETRDRSEASTHARPLKWGLLLRTEFRFCVPRPALDKKNAWRARTGRGGGGDPGRETRNPAARMPRGGRGWSRQGRQRHTPGQYSASPSSLPVHPTDGFSRWCPADGIRRAHSRPPTAPPTGAADKPVHPPDGLMRRPDVRLTEQGRCFENTWSHHW